MELVIDELKHGGGEAAEQTPGAGRDRLEDRPGIGRRGRDGAQNPGAGALTIARNRELTAKLRVLGCGRL
ncbi:hypothetical protein ACVWWO_008302 [Bradyrhizobium sp. F1.13.1]